MPRGAAGGRVRPVAKPDGASLHEAALRYLGRYAATEAGVVRVLDRRVLRWARESGAGEAEVAPLRQQARQVAARLVAAGVVDDAAYAEARARSLARAGRSSRAIAAHLTAKGVAAAVARRAAPTDPRHDLGAAVTAMRRRRIGPFRSAAGPLDPVARRRELAFLGRKGFPEALARQAIELPLEEAERLLLALRQGGEAGGG